MGVAPHESESLESAVSGHATVLHDRRRPGRREVAPELVAVLRGQGLKLVAAEQEESATALPLWDELASVSGIMRGIGIASLGWAAVAILVLH